MDILLASALIGGIAGGLAVVVVGLLVPRKSCPRCSSRLPRFRKPENLCEAMLGGWHCPGCNARIGRDGALLPDEAG